MFTGLIEQVGIISAIRPTATGRDITVRVEGWAGVQRPSSVEGVQRASSPASASAGGNARSTPTLGDSIAVNGICLTAVSLTPDSFTCHAGAETLARTTAGDWQPGRRVNLEQALQVGARLGGHFVQGHIDGVGTCTGRSDRGETTLFDLDLPAELAVYMVEKGSIAIDGISLTITRVTAGGFSVAIIPHTLGHTTLDELRSGTRVNLEVDLLAKYVRRALGLEQSGMTEEWLREQGFG